MTSTLDDALDYAEGGWPVFPCQWQGERRKRPLLPSPGLHLASKDPEQIETWWRRWPQALIGVPTGEVIGLSVLDIDRKDDANGYNTFADEFGFALWPATPTTHSPSGGAHLWFADPEGRIRNTS